ncbi:hypothetical protein MASR1M42_03530 [Azonexus hydrophilus]
MKYFPVCRSVRQSLRQRYTAQRYLSLFRAALNAGEMQRAGATAAPSKHCKALRWTYLRRGTSAAKFVITSI